MTNKLIKNLPWIAPTVAILAVGSGFMDRIKLSFAGDGQEIAQETSIETVKAAEAAIAAVQPVEETVPLTPAEPENVSQQLAVLLNGNSDVEVTRSAGFSIDTLEQARDVALGAEAATATPEPDPVGADFFAAAQESLARDNQCVEELRILASQARVYFPSGGLTGSQEGLGQARILGLLAHQCPGVTIRVEGHSDPSGDPVINQRLSLERAEAVVARVAASGVDAQLYDAVGLGDTVPSLVEGPQPSAFYDRRVEFSIVENAQPASYVAPSFETSGTQFQLAACVAQLEAAVQGASIEYAPSGMIVEDADFALASELATIAANCPQARLRLIGQHSDAAFSGEDSATGRLRAAVLMAKLVNAGFPSDQLILAAPSDSRPLDGFSNSRVDFAVIREEL
ncbi:OmpA family protein [Octadecabacter ascidiaceicola]|uniref:OmpA family protein n=1 Tax=Octadecabacter ascidiaceicola TaxID=1655543 RepID=A0A238JMF3_9RHOB|nr:OmpA family protein [Octadecabacter ascidiaceicola]SMX31849.1 OmpA family protein [Octadecabacter ascidiaceicola]